MSTSREEIREWLKQGLKQKASHCIVVCDSFSWEDYPVYVARDQNVKAVFNQYDGKRMQKVMEVYNLSMDIEAQLNQRRCFNF